MASTYAPCSACGKLNRVDLDAGSSREPICGSCKTSLPVHFGVVEVSDRGLETLITKSPIPVICDFWASWCGPCKAFAPTFQQAALRFAGRAAFVKLNTEQNPQAGSRHQIRGIPAIVLFSSGKEKDRLSGAYPLEQFSAWLEERLEN